MKQEREEYLQIIRDLEGDWEGRKKAVEHVAASDCYVYGRPAPFAFVPAFYNDEELEFFAGVCKTTHDILSKVIAHYVEDPDYRKLFSFSEEKERLMLLPCNYDEMLPMARFDFFLNEDDRSFKFCEFNADGAAAMSRTQIGCEAVALSESYRRFSEKHRNEPFEYFDTWVEEFLKTYGSDKNAKPDPNVLITDFTENVTMSDVVRYLEAFRKKGVSARYVDIRKLARDDRGLYDPEDGLVFDAVYRRAVTSDIVRCIDECRDLIKAVEEEKVCLIGHFRTTAVHSKIINVVLLDDMTKQLLTEEEWAFVQAHVLPTYRLRTDNSKLDIEKVKNNRNGWILKPEDDYDSHGVFAGMDLSEEEWQAAVDNYTDAGYIAMEYHVPNEYDTALPYKDENCEDPYGIELWHSMIGTYSFNGKHYGFFSRMGKEGVISESHNGVSVPSFRIV